MQLSSLSPFLLILEIWQFLNEKKKEIAKSLLLFEKRAQQLEMYTDYTLWLNIILPLI